MEIKGLNKFKTNVIYKSGFRVVYYYEVYHEALKGVHVENLSDFVEFFKEKELRKILQELIDLDYNYKNGLIDINIGLEAILCRYC